MIRFLRAAAISVFRQFPSLRSVAFAIWAPILHVALFPFRRPQGRGSATEPDELVRRTEEYNEAAERYFAEYSSPEYLLDKPFAETSEFAGHLISAGMLIAGARLRPGDIVVEFGAGSCWLSHFLNRFGCRTIAVDVSETALVLGRRLFERDPRTNWSLEPRFVVYDGHRLPLEDASCDRILVYDAFHHVPNQREVLAEMHRVLDPEGMVMMSEPGQDHGTSPTSVSETVTTGVLENELVIEDMAALAESVGFNEVNVLAASTRTRHEFPARQIGQFTGGRGFHGYWRGVCRDITQHHYVLMYKGRAQPTTARPGHLLAELRLVRPAGPVRLPCGESVRVHLRVANTGDTRWLHEGKGDARTGWTRIGVHLHEAADPMGVVIDFDWHRADLGTDLEPGDRTRVSLTLPAMETPGAYLLQFDLVIEGMTWFAECGASKPAMLRVDVD